MDHIYIRGSYTIFSVNPNCSIGLGTCSTLVYAEYDGLSNVELRITSEFATNHLLCYRACESYHSSIPSQPAIAAVGTNSANDRTITERPFAREFKIKESSTCLREAFSSTRGIRSGSVIQRDNRGARGKVGTLVLFL